MLHAHPEHFEGRSAAGSLLRNGNSRQRQLIRVHHQHSKVPLEDACVEFFHLAILTAVLWVCHCGVEAPRCYAHAGADLEVPESRLLVQRRAMSFRRFMSLSSALNSFASSRSCGRCPPFQALRDARALPSSLRGPVLFVQGFNCRISSACRCLRSSVQVVAMLVLQ